LKEA